jgi:hypothetical protein
MMRTPDDTPVDEATATFDATAPVRPPDAAAPPLPPRFEAIRRLGRGGQGEVWLAVDHSLAQHVALKIVSRGPDGPPSGRARREARLGRSLAHPNLVRVFDLIETEDHDIVVMEWVRGGAVTDAPDRLPMSPTEVELVGDQLLAALSCLHAAGVVHRDVKPSNVLVPEPRRFLLGDLGLVRQPDLASDLTVTTTGLGTPRYVAPEVLHGAPHSPASDLYALGVTLYVLLSGTSPFPETSMGSLVRAKSAPPPAIRRLRPDTPRWMHAFVTRLLEPDPGDRWPDAIAASVAWARQRAPSRRRRRRLALGVTIAAVACGLVLLGRSVWVPSAPATAAVVAGHVVASDDEGRELWSVSHPAAKVAVVADVLDGDGPEVAVGCTDPAPHNGVQTSWIDILDRRGEARMRVDPGTDFVSTIYPDLSNRVQVIRLIAHDLDDDGRSELVTILQHSHWYPSMVSIWSGTSDNPLRRLLVNSGSVNDLRFVDVDGDGRDEAVAVGLNNPMGYQVFAAVLSTAGILSSAHSPDNLGGWLRAHGSVGGLLAYTVLGPMIAPPELGAVGPDGFVVRQHDVETHLTPMAVPPWAGSEVDPRRRVAFWESLSTTCRAVIAGDPGGDAVAAFEARWPDLLREPPRRTAAELLLARSLAVAGERARAIGRLTTACRDLPDVGDLWLRRGELELIDGRTEAGRMSLSRALTAAATGRTPFDAVLMLNLDACVRSDDEAFEAAQRTTTAGLINWPESLREDMRALWHFVRAEWRDPSLADQPASPLFPAADVVRAWAALERGAPPADVLATADDLAANSEIAPLAELLRATELERMGRAEEARLAAQTATTELRRRGRTSFEDAIWQPLAGRVLASLEGGNTGPDIDR